MAAKTISFKVPERELNAVKSILRARGTTVGQSFRTWFRGIVSEAAEDAADLALAQERLKNLNVEDCTPMDAFARELGIPEEDLNNAPDDEIA